MGMCKPSGGINKTIYGPVRGNIEKKQDTPNSRTDYYDEITGEYCNNDGMDQMVWLFGTEIGNMGIRIILTLFHMTTLGIGQRKIHDKNLFPKMIIIVNKRSRL